MIFDGPEVSIRRSEVGLQLLNCRCSSGGERLNTPPIGFGQIFSPIAESTNQVLAPSKRNLTEMLLLFRRRSAGLAANALKSMAPWFDARKTSEDEDC